MGQKLEEAKQIESRILKDERVRNKEEMLRKGQDVSVTVIRPEYKMDERLKVDREVNAPPSNLYMALGWDEDKYSNRKHYRKFYDDELENIKEIFERPSPFDSYAITRGQSRGAKQGLFSKASKTDS